MFSPQFSEVDGLRIRIFGKVDSVGSSLLSYWAIKEVQEGTFLNFESSKKHLGKELANLEGDSGGNACVVVWGDWICLNPLHTHAMVF